MAHLPDTELRMHTLNTVCFHHAMRCLHWSLQARGNTEKQSRGQLSVPCNILKYTADPPLLH